MKIVKMPIQGQGAEVPTLGQMAQPPGDETLKP